VTRRLPFLLLAALVTSCATSPIANTRYEKPQSCARDEVMACDSGSRVANAPRFCTCQPAWQTLNTDM